MSLKPMNAELVDEDEEEPRVIPSYIGSSEPTRYDWMKADDLLHGIEGFDDSMYSRKILYKLQLGLEKRQVYYRYTNGQGITFLIPMCIDQVQCVRLMQQPVYHFTKDIGLAYFLALLDYNDLRPRGYAWFRAERQVPVITSQRFPDKTFLLGSRYTPDTLLLDYDAEIADRMKSFMEKRMNYYAETNDLDALTLCYGTGRDMVDTERRKGIQVVHLIPGRNEVVDVQGRPERGNNSFRQLLVDTPHFGLAWLRSKLKQYKGINEEIVNLRDAYHSIVMYVDPFLGKNDTLTMHRYDEEIEQVQGHPVLDCTTYPENTVETNPNLQCPRQLTISEGQFDDSGSKERVWWKDPSYVETTRSLEQSNTRNAPQLGVARVMDPLRDKSEWCFRSP